jgi:predicted transcriptional regulator
MNKRLETLLERVSALPEEVQDELFDHIAIIEAKHSGVYELSDDERAAVRRGLEEMRQGKFATDEEVEAVFSRYR